MYCGALERLLLVDDTEFMRVRKRVFKSIVPAHMRETAGDIANEVVRLRRCLKQSPLGEAAALSREEEDEMLNSRRALRVLLGRLAAQAEAAAAGSTLCVAAVGKALEALDFFMKRLLPHSLSESPLESAVGFQIPHCTKFVKPGTGLSACVKGVSGRRETGTPLQSLDPWDPLGTRQRGLASPALPPRKLANRWVPVNASPKNSLGKAVSVRPGAVVSVTVVKPETSETLSACTPLVEPPDESITASGEKRSIWSWFEGPFVIGLPF